MLIFLARYRLLDHFIKIPCLTYSYREIFNVCISSINPARGSERIAGERDQLDVFSASVKHSAAVG